MAWQFNRGGQVDRLTRKLGHHKQNKFKEFKHKPLNNEGYDGDIGAYQSDGGIVLCVKAFSRWWELTSDEE